MLLPRSLVRGQLKALALEEVAALTRSPLFRGAPANREHGLLVLLLFGSLNSSRLTVLSAVRKPALAKAHGG